MKPKQKSVCQTCRNRKLGCDGKLPECSQCTLSRRQCDGYRNHWTFIPQKTHTRKQSGLGQKDQKEQNNIPDRAEMPCYIFSNGQGHLPQQNAVLALPRSLSPIQSDMIDIIINSYMPENESSSMSYNSDYRNPRICGSWVEALPTFHNQWTCDSVLYKAINALGASIIAQRHSNTNTYISSQSYYSAICSVRKSFGSLNTVSQADLVAAIMCLTLVELMFPESVTGITAHTKAVGAMIQLYGPEAYKEGVLHRLFVGFRPLLIIEAFRHRQPIFLASREWIQMPFSISYPSLMQSLLDKAASIPSLLHQSDTILSTACQSQPLQVRQLFHSFLEILASLGKWENSLKNDTGGPCYWTNTNTMNFSQLDITHDLPFWYPNITMANVYTHLWSFYIICLDELDKLSSFFPCISLDGLTSTSQYNLDQVNIRVMELTKNICLSMEYLLQDEMKLFGPASSFFPLQIAYEKLEKSEPIHEKASYIESVVDRLVQKGLHSAPNLILRSDNQL